jgi:hypothetical protein
MNLSKERGTELPLKKVLLRLKSKVPLKIAKRKNEALFLRHVVIIIKQ